MKKIIVLTIIGMFWVTFAQACEDCVEPEPCDGGGCIDVIVSEQTLDIYTAGDVYGYGGDVTTFSEGVVGVNLNYGDYEGGDGGGFSGVGGWSSASQGVGEQSAGGEGYMYFDRMKETTWGTEGVLVGDEECGVDCATRYFDAEKLEIHAGAGFAAYGDDVNAFTAGLVFGDERVGDPADGNTFMFANGWDVNSVDTGFTEAIGQSNNYMEFKKTDFNAWFKSSE